MSPITLVTALFDLARREPETGRRTPAEYLDAADFVLGLDLDLVVFADPELGEALAARRAAAGRAERTTVVPTVLEEMPALGRLGRIEDARARRPVLNANPGKDTPLYTAFSWARVEMVRRAAETAAADASHLGWIDLGLAGRPDPRDEVFAAPRDRVTLLQMRGFRAADLADPEAYFSALRGHLAAGYIPASRENWLRFAAAFGRTAESALAAGFAPSDEQLLPALCLAEPELFDFRHGDYQAILANHLVLRTSGENLRFQLRTARTEGDGEHARAVAAEVLEGIRSGTFDAGGALLAELLDECFLAQWTGSGFQDEVAGEIIKLYRDRVDSDPDFRDVFLRDEVRVRENFALIDPA